jgi:hypothetical protein
MQDDWLGELAFMHYWRLLEERCPGAVLAPEFAHMSLVERQAWGIGIHALLALAGGAVPWCSVGAGVRAYESRRASGLD